MTWAYSTVTATGTAAIAATTMTFSATPTGTVSVGMVVTGTGVAANTIIVSGSGLAWVVSISQTVASTAVTTTLARLTSSGATESSPDSLLAGIAVVQTADASRGYRNGSIAWINNVDVILSGSSFVKADDDSSIEWRGSSGLRGTGAGSTNTILGGVICGGGAKFLLNVRFTRWTYFANGSTFVTQRRSPQDPAFSIYQIGTVRADFPSTGYFTVGASTLAKIEINGLDLYANISNINGLTSRLYGVATISSIKDVRCFDRFGNESMTIVLYGSSYLNLYNENLSFSSEVGGANTVTLISPTYYKGTPGPFAGLLRLSTYLVQNPTFLNNCWNQTIALTDVSSVSKISVGYTYTNTFKEGLANLSNVNVRFTRARQSVTGSPTWTAPNAVQTASSGAGGVYAALDLTDAYRAGTSASNLERFNWTAKARRFNYRSAGETLFASRVLYQHTVNMSAGYSEEVQMLALANAPATEAAGLAITGVTFDASGNATVSANRTALEIFQSWCSNSALTANFDWLDTWRYDGITLTLGANNLTVNAGVTLTGNLTTTGTITNSGTIVGSYQDSTGVYANISGLDPSALGTTWVLGWITDANYAARTPGTAPATWTGWNQTNGIGNSTQIPLAPSTLYQLFLRVPGYFAPIGPIATIDTTTQTLVTISPVVDTDLTGALLWPQTAAHTAQAALFSYNTLAQLVEYDNTSGVTDYVAFLAAYRALELIAKDPSMAYQLIQPLYLNGTRDGFLLPRANPLLARMTTASTAGAILQADISYADNQAAAFDRFRANPSHTYLLIPQATQTVSTSTIGAIQDGLALQASLVVVNQGVQKASLLIPYTTSI